MKAELIGILIVGTCICLAGACDFWLGTSYLAGIRENELNLRKQ